jgi:hypothetical protein
MYIRFVVGAEQEKLNELHGPFTEARLLRDEGALYEYEVTRINEIFDWFNDHMPCPPYSESKWPKNAISWFKVSSQAFISKIYEINVILKEHGVQVREIKEDYPGKILYEDKYQIVSVSAKY